MKDFDNITGTESRVEVLNQEERILTREANGASRADFAQFGCQRVIRFCAARDAVSVGTPLPQSHTHFSFSLTSFSFPEALVVATGTELIDCTTAELWSLRGVT